VRRGVQAPAVALEADRLEHIDDRGVLDVGLPRTREQALVRPAAGIGVLRHQRHQRLAQVGQQRPQLLGRQLRLEVVEQNVVGVLVAVEAGDVAVAQIDLPGQGVAEQAEVGLRARLHPGLLTERGGMAHLGREVGRHAHGLLEVAPRLSDQPDLLGVRVGVADPALQRVQKPPDLGIGLVLVRDALERRRCVRPRRGAARRHHGVLVPERQRADRAQVGERGEELVEGGELGRSSRTHRPTRA
jgi:hypothetical protein